MTTKRPTARRYPRDLSIGSRVFVRLVGCGRKPGTITELEQDGNRYRIVVHLDGNDTVRLYPAANSKLDLAPRQR